eukprot:scaffold12_cov128-Skeletonema_dohrnii-CCMP3373.AAC.13
MKSTSTITILLAAAASVVDPVQGREAMLGDEDKGQRRLFFKDINYEDIFDRCCDPEDGPWPSCTCPKRTSPDKSKLESWFKGGEENVKSYQQKWEEQCAEGGWLYKKANPTPNPN